MKPVIDIDECLRDSPKFREQLETQEANVGTLEQRLDKVLKSCTSMVESGKIYMDHRKSFTKSLWDLSEYFSEDSPVSSSMNRIIHSLSEMDKYHGILLDQASRTILKNLNAFVKVDIKGVKESKHHFEKISNDLDLALNRNSQVSRHKPADVEEAVNILSATRSCFRHTALDYVHTITMLQARKRHEILATFLSYVQACCTYHHQGADLSEDLEPFLKNIADEVTTMRTDTKSLCKEMENRHTVVNSEDTLLPSCDSNRKEMNSEEGMVTTPKLKHTPRMQGYLFKRTSNAFKTWNRRWFYLYENRLVYRKRTGELNETVMEEDLRLCTVKTWPDYERRFCFEVLSPSKSHMLQADSEKMMNSWVSALQSGIRSAIQQGMGKELGHSHSETHHHGNHRPPPINKFRIWEQLLNIPGNSKCCDCGSPEPRWASINLGITLCIECSGIHRSLGVHYSKVRSLTLDDWEPDIVKVMAELGNNLVNRIYEAEAENASMQRASPDCNPFTRETWIRAKYVTLMFVRRTILPHAADAADGCKESPLRNGRRWSVRRTRRRFRPVALVPETIADERSDVNSNTSAVESLEASMSGSENGLIVIGKDLAEERAIELVLPSDQDSTEGEDGEDVIGEEEISAQAVLFRAAQAHNIPVMMAALAQRADIDEPSARHKGQAPIHAAVASGSVMACSYLLINGSKLNVQDDDGKTPLHFATELGNTAQVCLLLKYRADQSIQDSEGQTPLDIAVANANADIVTLLRLTKLNEEMRECEMSGDDTYTQVFRDYTHLAHSHPERLLRNQHAAATAAATLPAGALPAAETAE